MDIIVKNLCKTYDRNQVLDHFSCTFREKKMTCIMGKSGIGKYFRKTACLKIWMR